MFIIDGRKISQLKRNQIKNQVEILSKAANRKPCLATILVGQNPASKIYISSKIKACQEVGIESVHFNLVQNSSRAEIISLIKQQNDNPDIDGILLQLPLPDNSFSQECVNAIDASKDVDGLTCYNVGALNSAKSFQEIISQNILIPCTPLGIINLLFYSQIEISGKNAVIIGRSNLVGKPLAALLLANNATVTIAHSHTKNLKDFTLMADICIAAVGRPNFIDSSFTKNDAAIIDVGINRLSNGIAGDVNFASFENTNCHITPVPGGVGPMTITSLLENTLKAFTNKIQKESVK